METKRSRARDWLVEGALVVFAYGVAVIIASVITVTIALVFGTATDGNFGQLFAGLPFIFTLGASMTASTAWPGYLVTHVTARMGYIPTKSLAFSIAGAATAIQALFVFGFFTNTPWGTLAAMAVVGGAIAGWSHFKLFKRLLRYTSQPTQSLEP